MDRRELLKMISLATGAAFIGGDLLLSGCQNADTAAKPFALTDDHLAFLNEVGETILPATATPGAKAADVANVMKAIVTDCYEEKDQQAFLAGIEELNNASQKKNGKSFLEASAAEREGTLREIDQQAKDYQKDKKPEDANHYFTMMKQLTLLGYFTSEAGCKEAQRFVPIPQRYDGCVPYVSGEKAITSFF